MHSIASFIIENLPTNADYPRGWTVALVLDFIEQSYMKHELKGFIRRDRYAEVYKILRRLHKQGKIDAAYGRGDNGREALTYNRF